MRTIEQQGWKRCNRCGRITRHHRFVAVRPADPRNLPAEIAARLHDKLHPWKCQEHGRGVRPPRPPSPETTFNPFVLYPERIPL